MSVLEFMRAITPFVVLIVMLLVTALGFFAKKFFDGWSKRLEEMGKFFDEQYQQLRERQDDHEKEFLRFQAQLPRIYTLKDDHIRHVTILERKIDALGDRVGSAIANLNEDVKTLIRDLPTKRGGE